MKLIRANKFPAFITSCMDCGRTIQADTEGGAWGCPGLPGLRCVNCKERLEGQCNVIKLAEAGDRWPAKS